MERAAWTDERLDDLAQWMDARFELIHRDLRDLGAEMGSMPGEMRSMRVEMRQRFDHLQVTMNIGWSMIVGLLGTILAFSLGGS